MIYSKDYNPKMAKMVLDLSQSVLAIFVGTVWSVDMFTIKSICYVFRTKAAEKSNDTTVSFAKDNFDY